MLYRWLPEKATKKRNNAFEPDLLESQAGAVASSPDVRKLFGELLEHTYGSPVG